MESIDSGRVSKMDHSCCSRNGPFWRPSQNQQNPAAAGMVHFGDPPRINGFLLQQEWSILETLPESMENPAAAGKVHSGDPPRMSENPAAAGKVHFGDPPGILRNPKES